MKILIIDSTDLNIPLLYNEFVKPIEKILKENNYEFETINFRKINEKNIEKFEKIIITGTALKDFEYLKDIEKFNFLKNISKPILGICAGFQIIGIINDLKLIENIEIGIENIEIIKENKLIKSKEIKSYCLHKKTLNLKNDTKFQILAKNENSIQLIKLKNKEIYGCQFHPEIKNSEIIINFIK